MPFGRVNFDVVNGSYESCHRKNSSVIIFMCFVKLQVRQDVITFFYSRTLLLRFHVPVYYMYQEMIPWYVRFGQTRIRYGLMQCIPLQSENSFWTGWDDNWCELKKRRCEDANVLWLLLNSSRSIFILILCRI